MSKLLLCSSLYSSIASAPLQSVKFKVIFRAYKNITEMVILRANELGAYCVRVPSRLLSIAFHKFSKFCKHKPQQFNTLHIPYAHIIPGRVVIGCNNSFVSFSPSRSYCLPFGFSFSIQCCSKIQCYRPDTKPNKIQRGGQHVYVRIKMWP